MDRTKQIAALLAAAGLSLSAGSAAQAYDAGMAEMYAKMFAPTSGAAAEKELRFVKPESFVKDIQAGKKVVTLDVRTPEETKVLGMTLPDSIAMPADQLFKPENLSKVPADKPVLVVCKSGARAAVAGTALRSLGFENVHVLKGGLEALAVYYGAKEAYPEAEGKK